MAHWVTLQGTCGGEQAGEGFWWSISIVSVHSRVTKDLWLVPGIEDQNAAVPEVERGHGIDPVCVSAVRGEETHPVLPAPSRTRGTTAAVSAESFCSLSVSLGKMAVSLISFGILENILLKFLFLWGVTFLRLESVSHRGTEVFPNLWEKICFHE